MQTKYYMIQMTDCEAAEMLQAMAKAEKRSYGNQVAYLIRQEYARRSSTEHNKISAPVNETTPNQQSG